MTVPGESDARERAVRLAPGERFPDLRASRVGGGEIVAPPDAADRWTVVLFYRGHWCPYCRRQLTDFQRRLQDFEKASITVVALSADPEAEARSTVEEHGLELPVGYGLEAARIQARYGSYLGGDRDYVQATGFVLDPAGRVQLAVYSSGAIGRLSAADVLGMIEHVRAADD